MNGVKFVERLRAILQEKNISQNQLLKDNGLAKGSIANWEQRGNIPAADTVFKIAKYLEVSAEYLVNGEVQIDKEAIKNFLQAGEPGKADYEVKITATDEEILISNYQKLNENNKKIIQALIQYMILNQD